MKIITVIVCTFLFIGLQQVQATSLISRPSPVGKAMLLKLIAPDKSEHLIACVAHRMGLRLEQLPELVGAIRQANVLIGELAPCWGHSQHTSCNTKAMFADVETVIASLTVTINKQLDATQSEGGNVEEAREHLKTMRSIVGAIGEIRNNLVKNNFQIRNLGEGLTIAGGTPLSMQNIQIIEGGRTKIDIGGTDVYFNPSDNLESLMVQLLAGGLNNLVKVYLAKQHVVGEADYQSDPEFVYSDQSHQPLAKQLEQEYLHKLRKMLQQYSHNPIANLLNLTLEYQSVAAVNSTLTSIAISEASKEYGKLLDPDAPVLDAQIAATALGGTREHVALESIEDWQQHINEYFSKASEHFRSLDGFIGNTTNLKRVIDHNGIDAATKRYKKMFADYFRGDIFAVSSLKNSSVFNPYHDDIMLDQRNLNWMEGGKIQEHCTKDNQCLVYVGFSHLLRGKYPLVKLLQQEGFEIKELTTEQREELIAAAASDNHEYAEYGHDGEQSYELSLLERARRGDDLTQHQRNEALIEAVASEDLNMVKWAIDKGVDANFISQALQEAVAHEHAVVVELLVANLPEDDAGIAINRAANIAALQGKLQIVKFLVSKGANDLNGYLINAAYGGSREVVGYLIEQGADNVEEALIGAVFRDHIKLVEFLIPKLEEKKSPENFRLALNNLLPFSAENRGMKILDLIVDAGGDDFNNLLLHAANIGNKNKIEFAVKKGADNFTAAFLQAVYAEHNSAAKYLFDLIQQHKPDEVNDVATQAFSHAIARENTELAKFLVRENSVSIDIATVLTVGAKHESILEYVVQKGVNYPTWTTSAWTIQYAVANGWIKTLEIIFRELNHDPHEALLLASSHGNEEIVKLILQIGVGIDSLRTARDLALFYKHDNVHQLLNDKLEEGNLLTTSTRVEKFFDANISLVTDTDDAPLSKALAQKIVHNNRHENNVAFTRLDDAVKDAGDWSALAVAMQGKKNYANTRFRNSLVRAVVAGKDKHLISEVVLLYRLINAVQKLEGGTAQGHASKLGISTSSNASYTYSSHLEGKRVSNLTKMRAHIAALRARYQNNNEKLHEVLAAAEVLLKKLDK